MFRNVYLIFRYFFGDPVPEIPEFDADRATTDHALRDARARARHGDWQAARKVIDDAGADWELRGKRVSSLSGLAATEDGWLYAWLSARPEDPTAVLLQAEMLGSRAGKARGAASADQTSAEQFQNFHALSEAASQVGQRAMELAPPHDPLPWVHMLSTMFGDERARASLDEVFAEGRRRDPYNFSLHSTAVSLRCQKWFGSHEQMFGTAREVAQAAPPGAGAVMLPLFAHIEYVLVEFTWEDDSVKSSVKKSRQYFRRPEVQQEVDGWIAKYRAGTPNPVTRSMCLQWMAMFYTLAGRRKAAKAVFDELGQYVVPVSAWAYIWGGSEAGYLSSWMWANRI